jgi:hypothetical protein
MYATTKAPFKAIYLIQISTRFQRFGTHSHLTKDGGKVEGRSLTWVGSGENETQVMLKEKKTKKKKRKCK